MPPALLITRPAEQAARFASAARGRLGERVDIVLAPLLRIAPMPLTVDPERYAGLVFTSSYGVGTFAASCAGRHWPVWCVGTHTADHATAAGFSQVTSAAEEGGDAEGLLRLLLSRPPQPPLLHLHGVHSAGRLAARLTAAALPCDDAAIYDQVAQPLSVEGAALLSGTRTVLLPLFSPRTALLVAKAVAGATAPLRPLAISDAAAAAWSGLRPEPVAVAAAPDAAAMLDALERMAAAS